MKKFLFTIGVCLTLALTLAIPAAAAESAPTSITEESAQIATEEAAEENIFFSFYEELNEHLPELFSALSLLGACIIAFCYKRGLLPLLKEGIGAIGATASDAGRKAESYAKESREICEKANESIHLTASYMKSIEKLLSSLDEKIGLLGDQKEENRLLHELMNGQVDMLLEIFLASSLPQFEKDRVSRQVEKMKLALLTGEHTEESYV